MLKTEDSDSGPVRFEIVSKSSSSSPPVAPPAAPPTAPPTAPPAAKAAGDVLDAGDQGSGFPGGAEAAPAIQGSNQIKIRIKHNLHNPVQSLVEASVPFGATDAVAGAE